MTEPVQLSFLKQLRQIGDDYKASAQIDGMIAIIEGRTYRAGDHYVATIEGGWWVGRGKTAQEAIKKAIDAYALETYAQKYGVLP